MKRSVYLMLVLLASALWLYAEDMDKATEMTGWLCNSKCVSKNAGHAACDQRCTEKSADIVFVDDHGQVYKIDNQDKVMSKAGKKVKMKCRPAKDEKDTMYVDTVSLYGGGG
jgi:hypothetical protein